MSDRSTAVGLAMSDALPGLLAAEPQLVDYVELPFERLVHEPDLCTSLNVPVILHCASLSLAGNLRPAEPLVARLRQAAAASATPWIGEHLAFVSMNKDVGSSLGHTAFAPSVDDAGVVSADAELYNVGYTVSPQYSDEILARVTGALDHWERVLECPLLIENGPVYFDVPGSTMSQTEFINRLCRERPGTRLLLDLAHLACTAANTATNAAALLESLPLERVVEVHLSGFDGSEGTVWDDHAVPIQPEVFDLLDRLLRRIRPQAITVEYNWDPDFPVDILRRDLGRVRNALVRSTVAA